MVAVPSRQVCIALPLIGISLALSAAVRTELLRRGFKIGVILHPAPLRELKRQTHAREPFEIPSDCRGMEPKSVGLNGDSDPATPPMRGEGGQALWNSKAAHHYFSLGGQ
jgi:hypothetical protein